MESIQKTILCAAFVAIALSFTTPVYGSNVQPTATSLQSSLANGFSDYLNTIGVKTAAITSDQTASTYFAQFLNADPQYQTTLKQYDQMVHPAAKASRLSPTDFSSLTLGPVISTSTVTINGITYTLQLQQGTLAHGTTVLKATYIGPDGIVDPWIYVSISYLTVPVLWWTVTYGEDQWLYEHFVTNSGGINEAALFRANVDGNAIQQGTLIGVVSGIAGIVTATVCGGCGVLAGAVPAYILAWYVYTMDTGYDSNYGEYVAMNNHYLYTQLGSYLAVWTFWWIDWNWHLAFPPPYLGPTAYGIGTQISSTLSSVMHTYANWYGTNRWVWIGTYRG